jgi:hypothetical protein
MRVWHYTICVAFEKIYISGRIETTAIGIESNEKPAVWFFINSNWEETVRRTLRDTVTGKTTTALSRDGLFEAGITPVRIEVDPGLPFLTWEKYKKKSGISKKFARVLEQVAKECGANPKEWRVLFSPVSAEYWLLVEIWNGHTWVERAWSC